MRAKPHSGPKCKTCGVRLMWRPTPAGGPPVCLETVKWDRVPDPTLALWWQDEEFWRPCVTEEDFAQPDIWVCHTSRPGHEIYSRFFAPEPKEEPVEPEQEDVQLQIGGEG